MTAPKSGTDHAALRAWGRAHLRDLPWRQVRDPWWILCAEVMSQQTTIARVVPRWVELVQVYPVPAALAAAPLGDLLRLWEGLGYPRRARNLHAAAQVITEQHAGVVPDDLDMLLALPGIGPYTARAVLAFAYEHDVGVVDANTSRVLARVHGRRLRVREAQTLADAWVPPGAGWWWNQTLIDVGNAVCRPAPCCGDCPLSGGCAWSLAGCPAPDPADGSAGVSRPQARFEGSLRQRRGAVLRALTRGSAVPTDDEAIASLLADGLVVRVAGRLALPD